MSGGLVMSQRYPYRNNGLPSGVSVVDLKRGSVVSIFKTDMKTPVRAVIVRVMTTVTFRYRGKVEFEILTEESELRKINGRSVISLDGDIKNYLNGSLT